MLRLHLADDLFQTSSERVRQSCITQGSHDLSLRHVMPEIRVHIDVFSDLCLQCSLRVLDDIVVDERVGTIYSTAKTRSSDSLTQLE